MSKDLSSTDSPPSYEEVMKLNDKPIPSAPPVDPFYFTLPKPTHTLKKSNATPKWVMDDFFEINICEKIQTDNLDRVKELVKQREKGDEDIKKYFHQNFNYEKNE